MVTNPYKSFTDARGHDYKSGGLDPDQDYASEWDEASRMRVRDARLALGQAERGTTAAQGQLQAGTAQAQRSLAHQSAGGGAGAAREAMYGAADLETGARVQSDLLRAQEAASARMAYNAALQQQGEAQFGQDQYRLQDHQGDEQRRLEDAQRSAMGAEADRQRAMQAVGSTLSAVGMGMSDRRRKRMY